MQHTQSEALNIHGFERDIEDEIQALKDLNVQAPILLIDDAEMNLNVFRKQLFKLGFKTLLAENGKIGLETAQQHECQLIFADCSMPVMDGYEFTYRYRDWEAEQKNGQHTPIIAMTAHAIAGDEEKCYRAGMDDYLSKPVTVEKLVQKLSHWLLQKEIQTPKGLETSSRQQKSEPIDLDFLSNILGETNDEEIAEVLQSFLQKIEPEMAQLSKSLIHHDHLEMETTAHKAKGMAGYAAAIQLQEMFNQIEVESVNQNWKKIEHEYQKGISELKRIKVFVKHIRSTSIYGGHSL